MTKKRKTRRSREYTEDEVREEFLREIYHLIDYWENEARTPALRDKLEGLAFSILVDIDGEGKFPGFILAPDPHPDDKKYHQERGENYYPENYKSKVKCNISGSLHEMFYVCEARDYRSDDEDE